MVISNTFEFIHHTLAPSNPETSISINIKWFPPPPPPPPPPDHFKLNTHGSFSNISCGSGIGEVIKDDQRNWRVGYYKRSHSHNHIMEKLEALSTGLQFSITYNLKPLEVESDSIDLLRYLEEPVSL
ncbi:hypothetical protein RDI58_010674 [Solanum bulbocastanum]|uniref:RNase H type-1 domain-containing protein n=1 Tax=Solanum bulbocastanum TaxID=147425 RepID=A0AAN8YJQ6_SOLBU